MGTTANKESGVLSNSRLIVHDSFIERVRAQVLGRRFPEDTFQEGSRVIFIGNPGVGKSTLLNSIVQKTVFRSGVSIGTGLTMQEAEHVFHNVHFVDTPGLADNTKIEAAAQEIYQSLTRGGTYYLFFVIVLQAGRVRSDDSSTMRIVLEALKNIPHLSYGVIVNQVTPAVRGKLQDERLFEQFVVNLFGKLPLSTESIFLNDEYREARDEEDVLVPPDKKLLSFLAGIDAINVDPKKVAQLQVDKFEQFKEEMDREYERLKQENSYLVKRLQDLERESSERVRALEDEVKRLDGLVKKMTESDISARPATESCGPGRMKKIVNEEKPTENIHKCVKHGIGRDLWKEESWIAARKRIEEHLKSPTIQDLLVTYPGLTEDMLGAIVYYTFDINENSVYHLLNQDLVNSRSGGSFWMGFLWYAYQAFLHLPKFRGTVYRGISKALFAEERYVKGYKVTYNAFTSSSTNPRVARQFTHTKSSGITSTLMVITDTTSGVDVTCCSCFPAEQEVIFFPGATFRVTERSEDDKRRIIYLVEDNP